MAARPAILLLATLISGCWARPDIPAKAFPGDGWTDVDDDVQRRAFDRLDTLETGQLAAGWLKLDSFGFQIDRDLVVRDEEDRVVARVTQEARIDGPADNRRVSVIRSDSSGTFERSFWSRFSEAEGLTVADGFARAPADLPGLLLPDDPLFLSVQGLSYFMYRPVQDTAIGGLPVQVFETRVRPETSRHGIQWARFYARNDSLVGLDAAFVQQSLLYEEITWMSLLLSPAHGEWIPERADLKSTVGLPFARSRTYEMHIRYSDRRPIQQSPREP